MTAEQIQAARKSLSAFRTEFERFRGVAANVGRSAAKSFGKNFKTIAVFTVTELARGALPAIGARIVENWGKTGTKTGRSFGKRMKKAASDELKTMGSSGGGSALGGMLKFTGIAAAASLAAATVASSFQEAMEKERIEISLDALSADGAGGSRLFEAIRQDALRTGVEVAAQAQNIQKMMAQGMDESTALDLNDALLDVGSGAGLTGDEIGLLGNALSQVKGKGVSAMEELKGQIAEKGVPIFEALRQRFGAEDIGAVFDMISAGKVSADDTINAFKNLEGPFAKFLGASDRIGKTGGGLFARLVAHATDLKQIFATEVMPELKPALEFAIGLIVKMKEGAKEFGTKLAEVIGWVQAAFESLSLEEMLALAGLVLKEKLIEALDFAARGIAAVMKAMENGSFGAMLEQAALRFKEVMLLAVSEILRSLEAALPEGGRLALAVGAAANQTEIRGNIAGADREAIESKMGSMPEIWEQIKKDFAASPQMFGSSMGDQMEKEYLMAKIFAQRTANVAGREGDGPIVGGDAPGGDGPKTPFDATNMVGGGLANAISRITGGGDILMTKQLETQEDIRSAVEKAAAEAKRNADAAEKLVTNTTPRRGGRSMQAQLVL